MAKKKFEHRTPAPLYRPADAPAETVVKPKRRPSAKTEDAAPKAMNGKKPAAPRKGPETKPPASPAKKAQKAAKPKPRGKAAAAK